MHEAKHAIEVAPVPQGWTWELIDNEGSTAAAGVAPHQEDAMSSAWSAARSFSASASEFPAIIVRHP
jgi:hypothetical protein